MQVLFWIVYLALALVLVLWLVLLNLHGPVGRAVRRYILVIVVYLPARYVNWRLVRGLGELQILTRASYFVLILVPILAAIWPAVQSTVNQYNKTVTEVAAIFDRAAVRISEAQNKIPNAIMKP